MNIENSSLLLGCIDIPPLVVNYHLTEACNYECKYCYAAWRKPDNKELFHRPGQSRELLGELRRLQSLGGAHPVRINFAGGEPLLYPSQLQDMIEYTAELGMQPSIITNASLLTRERLMAMAPYLKVLGISLDSTSMATDMAANQLIGRADSTGNTLDIAALASMLNDVRERHPELSLKLNTVVNQVNHGEDFGALLEMLKPDRWKVLRMLPATTTALQVTTQHYEGFVKRHARFARIMFAEDNHEMRNSYLMIDPRGRFFQNDQVAPGGDYQYSRPILEVGVEAALSDIKFDGSKFASRYESQSDKTES